MIPQLAALVLVLATPGIAQSVLQQTSAYPDLVSSNTRFAFKFFQVSAAGTPNENVLLSPVSLSLDFALLQNGAEKEARKEILSTFEFGELSPEVINERSLSLRKALIYDPPPKVPPRRPAKQGIQPPLICCAPPPEHLSLAGSLWTQPAVAFKSKFLEINKKFYSFQLGSVPNKGPAATRAVNAWSARQTGGLVNTALDSWRDDDFLMVDTTSFKGSWVKPFYEEETHPGDFNLPSGDKKRIPMMVQVGMYRYLRGPKFQAVRLPYSHAAMYVFLPDADSNLQGFERNLNADNWIKWLSDMAEQEGSLKLPRFRVEYRAELAENLSNLGMSHAFRPFFSFGPLVENPEGAALTRVVQAVTIKVDEKGTEAASVTFTGGVIGGISSDPKPEPFRMIVDHPFFFAICDNETGTILYLGAVNDPSPIASAH